MNLPQLDSKGRLSVTCASGSVALTEGEFSEFARLIEGELGLKMPKAKRSMLGSRLARRLRKLGLQDYGQYFEHLQQSQVDGEEFQQFIDLVTTHKTAFFREPQHFSVLQTRVLPELICQRGRTGPLRIWSAACSSGEEVYSLAMTLDHTCSKSRQAIDYTILGTDVALEVLHSARLGIYPLEVAGQIPEEYQSQYLLRSRNDDEAKIRIVPQLRAKAQFAVLNFMAANWDKRPLMDIIFCRNALIYFDRRLQELIVDRLVDQLNAGGFLFLGHTEGLAPTATRLEALGNCVYRKRKPSRWHPEPPSSQWGVR